MDVDPQPVQQPAEGGPNQQPQNAAPVNAPAAAAADTNPVNAFQKDFKHTLPTFSGRANERVEDWLFSLGLYCKARNINPNDPCLLPQLAILLRGAALTWWRTVHDSPSQPRTPLEFAAALEAAFATINPVKTARDQLATIRQRKSVRDYAAQFRQITVFIPNITDDEKKDRFIRGLKPKVMEEVVMKDPATFADAVMMAERYDTIAFQLSRTGRPNQPPHSFYFREISNSNGRGNHAADTASPMELGAIRSSPPRHAPPGSHPPAGSQGASARFTKLTPELRQQLLREGKCFYCRKPGHTAVACPNKRQGHPNDSRQ
jgi:hypothetical protein